MHCSALLTTMVDQLDHLSPKWHYFSVKVGSSPALSINFISLPNQTNSFLLETHELWAVSSVFGGTWCWQWGRWHALLIVGWDIDLTSDIGHKLKCFSMVIRRKGSCVVWWCQMTAVTSNNVPVLCWAATLLLWDVHAIPLFLWACITSIHFRVLKDQAYFWLVCVRNQELKWERKERILLTSKKRTKNKRENSPSEVSPSQRISPFTKS